MEACSRFFVVRIQFDMKKPIYSETSLSPLPAYPMFVKFLWLYIYMKFRVTVTCRSNNTPVNEIFFYKSFMCHQWPLSGTTKTKKLTKFIKKE